MSVLVVDRAASPGAGTSDVAAGMLAPVTEMDFGEEGPLRANMLARERWPGFAAELEEVTGLPTGYRDSGALVVAADRDDAEALHRLHELHASLGMASEWLTPSRCRALEPGLSPRIAGGILAPQDGSADPRATVRALAAAATEVELAAPGEIELGLEVEAIEHDGSSVTGIRTRAGTIESDHVVVAAGPWSASLAPVGDGPPVRPVKGQIIELRTRGAMPSPFDRVLRTPRCYLVSRGDGRVVLGATVEEQGFDTTVTADGVFRLLEAAWEVLPEVGELELVGARAGLRPGTPDNAPIVGPDAEVAGLIWATGHWRNGVLLAPVTGDAVAAMLAGETPRKGSDPSTRVEGLRA
jgi:glycine oxidase